MQRVFVTGIGLVTPLATSAPATWAALLAGRSAVAAHQHHPAIPTRLAARVPRGHDDIPPPSKANQPEALDLCVFSHHAASEALRDAGLHTSVSPLDHDTTGVSLGVCIPYLPDAAAIAAHLDAGRFRRISPYCVTRVLPSTPAALLAISHALRGPLYAQATACAAGASALSDGLHVIRRGDATAMLAGGADASLHAIVAAAFARIGAFAPGPLPSAGPFDHRRAGFVPAEGAAVLVLEPEYAVRARNAPVYAELRAAVAGADAHAIVAPSPRGVGAERVMRTALKAAGVTASQVDYVNAHATATPAGDAAERAALSRIFENSDVVVSSTKGATGHMLAAAGAVEAAFAAMAIAEGVVPPTVGLEELDTDSDISDRGWGDVQRFVPQRPLQKRVRVALSNSFGFGGINTCLVLTEPPEGIGRKRVAAFAGKVDNEVMSPAARVAATSS